MCSKTEVELRVFATYHHDSDSYSFAVAQVDAEGGSDLAVLGSSASCSELSAECSSAISEALRSWAPSTPHSSAPRTSTAVVPSTTTNWC